MKRIVSVVALIVGIGVGAVHAQSDPLDLVVLVDTSASMFPYWHDTTHYMIRDILKNVLHKGDSFHLVSFASRPELEISRKMESDKDVQAVLARFLLLQPLGRHTDLVAAIRYLDRYVPGLPPAPQKEIIILTDGIDDPPPGSPYPIHGAANIRRDKRLVVDAVRRMRKEGWVIRIVQYPIAGTPASATGQQPGVQLLGESGKTAAATGGSGAAPLVTVPLRAPSGSAAPRAGAASSPTSPQASSQPSPRIEGPRASSSSSARASGTTAPRGTTPQSTTPRAASPAPSATVPGSARASHQAAPRGGSPGVSSTQGAVGRPSPGTSTSTAAKGAGSGAASSQAKGKTPLLNALSQAAGTPIEQYNGVSKNNLANIATGAPSVIFPKSLGRIGYTATVPFGIRNFQGRAITVRLRAIRYDGANILRRPVSLQIASMKQATLNAPIRLPASLAPGSRSIRVSLEFADQLRESPRSGTLSFVLVGAPSQAEGGFLHGVNLGRYALPAGIAVVIIVLVLLVIFFIRRIVANLNAAPTALPRARFEMTRMSIHPVEMRVIGQNPNIGGRNIHPIGAGSRRSVGGRGSAFLIYLYPCPPRIAEIVRREEDYLFLPLKRELFPGIEAELPDCIGKEIRIRLEQGREVTIVFRRYVSPLDEVNRIMHLIDKPGPPVRDAT